MKISCKVNRIEVKDLNVDGKVTSTAIVKLVPTDIIGDFYFAVPGGTVTYNPEDLVIETKSPDGQSITRKVTDPKGTRPLSVKSPEGSVFEVDATITIDVSPVQAPPAEQAS